MTHTRPLFSSCGALSRGRAGWPCVSPWLRLIPFFLLSDSGKPWGYWLSNKQKQKIFCNLVSQRGLCPYSLSIALNDARTHHLEQTNWTNDSVIQEKRWNNKNCKAAGETSRPLRLLSAQVPSCSPVTFRLALHKKFQVPNALLALSL